MASYLDPAEILAVTIKKGEAKAANSLVGLTSLGFLGGAFISAGYLAYIRVAGAIPSDWSGLATLLGSAVFPIGLICILIGGGELITGNMMAVSAAWFAKKVTTLQLLRNWAVVTFANLLGALFVAYFFGHIVGLTEGAFLEKTVHLAETKIAVDFWQSFVSGIGCNWFVGMGLWLCYGAKDVTGKILGTWFPVMTFVLIGFQHVVANMFVIPAAIWAGGHFTWGDFIANAIPVYLGNMVGGATLVAGLYTIAYRPKQ